MSYFFENIEIKNFRLLKSSKNFELRPITLLTGKNNSGKSSLIDFLMLLQQSLKGHNKLFELDFFGYQKLGGFDKNINYKVASKKMVIKAPLELRKFTDKFQVVLEYEKSPNNKYNGILSKISIFNQHTKKLFLCIEHNNKHFSFVKAEPVVGEERMSKLPHYNLHYYIDFPYVVRFFKKAFSFYTKEGATEEEVKERRKKDFRDMFDDDQEAARLDWHEARAIDAERLKTPFYKLSRFFLPKKPPTLKVPTLSISQSKRKGLKFTTEDVLQFLQLLDKNTSHLYYQYKDAIGTKITRGHELYEDLLKFENKIFKEVAEIDLGYEEISTHDHFNLRAYLVDVSSTIDRHIKDACNKHYKETVSAGSKDNCGEWLVNKFIVENVSNALDELVESNKIIDLMPLSDVQSNTLDGPVNLFYHNDIEKDSHEGIFLCNWFKELGLPQEWRFKENDNQTIDILFKHENNWVGLNSFGSGIVKLVPILLHIANIAYKKCDYLISFNYTTTLMIVEEPETHLHPDYQSKLADIFIDASDKFKFQFIIETHSEYIIRRLQYWTAKGAIQPNDTIMYYFEQNAKTSSAKITPITIEENGNLSDEFGEGFIDETPRLLFDILSFKNKASPN